jgi:hypothetical protein
VVTAREDIELTFNPQELRSIPGGLVALFFKPVGVHEVRRGIVRRSENGLKRFSTKQVATACRLQGCAYRTVRKAHRHNCAR